MSLTATVGSGCDALRSVRLHVSIQAGHRAIAWPTSCQEAHQTCTTPYSDQHSTLCWWDITITSQLWPVLEFLLEGWWFGRLRSWVVLLSEKKHVAANIVKIGRGSGICTLVNATLAPCVLNYVALPSLRIPPPVHHWYVNTGRLMWQSYTVMVNELNCCMCYWPKHPSVAAVISKNCETKTMKYKLYS